MVVDCAEDVFCCYLWDLCFLWLSDFYVKATEEKSSLETMQQLVVVCVITIFFFTRILAV